MKRNDTLASEGFSLIELLVAMGVILAITGGVLINYNSYNDSQRLKQAALTLKEQMRYAQSQANAVVKPSSGCTRYIGKRISFEDNLYTLETICTEGVVGSPVEVRLASGIVFYPIPPDITFEVLTGSAHNAPVTVQLSSNSRTYAIQVSQNGEIQDGGFIE